MSHLTLLPALLSALLLLAPPAAADAVPPAGPQAAPLPADPATLRPAGWRLTPEAPELPADAGAAERSAPPQLDAFGLPCAPKVSLKALRGALLQVQVLAPCHAGERVELLHAELRLLAPLDALGALQMQLPALARQAEVSLVFGDGSRISRSAVVEDISALHRVLLLMPEPGPLSLHAREPAQPRQETRHVWSGNRRSLEQTLRGHGGSLQRIETTRPLLEVYSARSDAATVRLSLEAAVTEENCARSWPARILVLSPGAPARSSALRLRPDCDAAGSVLRLRHVMPDLTRASR